MSVHSMYVCERNLVCTCKCERRRECVCGEGKVLVMWHIRDKEVFVSTPIH